MGGRRYNLNTDNKTKTDLYRNERQRKFYKNNRDRVRKKGREIYVSRINQGLCPRCAGVREDENLKLCNNCLNRARVSRDKVRERVLSCGKSSYEREEDKKT